MKLRFSANLGFLFTELSNYGDRYLAAKRYGFAAVETPFPTFDVKAVGAIKAAAGGLEQPLMNAYSGQPGEFGIAALPGREPEFNTGLDLTIEYAKLLNCGTIHVMAGQLPADADPDRMQKTYLSNLKSACEKCESAGLTVVIEPICEYGVPRYYLTDINRAVDVIGRVDSPNLKLLFDFFHIQQTHGNLTNLLRAHMPLIGHIQIAQVPTRHEPDSTGELNYDYLFELIESLDYRGWIGCEYRPANGTEHGLKWLKRYL